MRAEEPVAGASQGRAAICFTGKPEVLVVSTAWGARCGTTRESSAVLMARFSATASDDPVALGELEQIVVKVARGHQARPETRRQRPPAWPLHQEASSAAVASLFFTPSPAGTMSRSSTGMPALARWAAMREPMVPAPKTAARRTRSGKASAEKDGAEGVANDVVLMRALPEAGAASGLEARASPAHNRSQHTEVGRLRSRSDGKRSVFARTSCAGIQTPCSRFQRGDKRDGKVCRL